MEGCSFPANISSRANLTVAGAALEALGGADLFASNSTVFLPTDTAFAGLLTALSESLAYRDQKFSQQWRFLFISDGGAVLSSTYSLSASVIEEGCECIPAAAASLPWRVPLALAATRAHCIGHRTTALELTMTRWDLSDCSKACAALVVCGPALWHSDAHARTSSRAQM